MYSMIIIFNSTYTVYLKAIKRIDIKSSHHKNIVTTCGDEC